MHLRIATISPIEFVGHFKHIWRGEYENPKSLFDYLVDSVTVESDPAGVAQIREGLAICRSTGAMLDYPFFLALLAEALGYADQPQEGLDTAAEALAMLGDRRSFYYEAELHRRLRGLTARLDVVDGDLLADRLHVAIVGAFAVGGVYPAGGPADGLPDLVDVLLSAAVPVGSPTVRSLPPLRDPTAPVP